MKNDYVLPVLLCAVLGAGAASNTYGSPFDSGVQRDRPILYLPMDHDPSHVYAQMPNGDHAKVFNGTSDFVEVSSPALSIPNKGVLTIEAGTAIDPVCGMTVTISDDAIYADVDGERVWFCCPPCRRAYVADPGKYPREQPAGS